jgi:diguanylate cyclase (GGDEF)-like protein/PAS domain S-box-containing protein
MSVPAKLFIPISVLTALFLLTAGYWLMDLRMLDRRLEEAAAEVNLLNSLSLRLSRAEERQAVNLLSFPLSGRVEYLAEVAEDNREAKAVLAQLERAMADDPRARQLLADYLRNRQGLEGIREGLVNATRLGGGQTLDAAFARWRLKQRNLSAMRRDLIAYTNKYPGRTLASLGAAQERAMGVFFGFAVLATLLFAAAVYYYRRLINRPLQRLTRVAHEFAAGRLEARAALARRDEFGQLSHAFDGMAANLQAAQAAQAAQVREKSRQLEERERMASRLEQINAQLYATQAGLQEEVQRRQASQEALAREKERAQVTLMSLADGVITTDRGGAVESLNPVAEGLTGWSLGEAQGRPVTEVFHVVEEDTREPPAEDAVLRCLRRGEPTAAACQGILISRDGRELHIDQAIAPIRDKAGNIEGSVVVFHDVTEARQLTRQMAYQARHDPLTGLINRREFELRLEHALASAREQGAEHVLLYMDLDRFKLVNDSCGHAAGDELLRQLTAMLSEHMRSRDTFARLGGDEFGVLLEHCQVERGLELAEDYRQLIHDFRFHWQQRTFGLGVSIGLAPVAADSESVDQVLARADAACYAAKAGGRDRVVVADGSVEHAERNEQAQWSVRIREALEQDRLDLNYLMVAPAAAGDGGLLYEVLLTMRGGDDRPIPPAAFMPAAERFGLMPAIDRWVVEHTLVWLAAHSEHLQQLTLCTINLSGQSVAEDGFCRFIEDRLAHHRVPPHKICFEISEAAAVASLPRVRQFMERLGSIGCRFSLDDCGGSFASYEHLKQLPLDYLKIDGNVVRDIDQDPVDLALVESINRIGHVVGARTIAEFVESEAIFERLRAMGVDYAQGFGISLPQPIGRLADGGAATARH